VAVLISVCSTKTPDNCIDQKAQPKTTAET